MAPRLSVNLNKVALLRNSRGHDNPSPLRAAEAVLDAGADGITLHWRQDNRHTREADVREIRAECRARGVEFNLEGDAREELIALALELQVDQFTLVPVTPGEITSDHGWDLPRQSEMLAELLARFAGTKTRTAIFLDPDPRAAALAGATGANRVELYTEPYARAFGTPGQRQAVENLAACAKALTSQGLGVNAGHDLDLRNLPHVVSQVPEIAEVSIGHALIADALYLGWPETIARYLAACRGQVCPAPATR